MRKATILFETMPVLESTPQKKTTILFHLLSPYLTRDRPVGIFLQILPPLPNFYGKPEVKYNSNPTV